MKAKYATADMFRSGTSIPYNVHELHAGSVL